MTRRLFILTTIAAIAQPKNREGVILAAIVEKERVKRYEKLTKSVNESLKYIATADGLPDAGRRTYYRELSAIHGEWHDEFSQLAELK